MKQDAWKYLLGEIVEEGHIYICFKYLEKNYGLTLQKFKETILKLESDGICSFYIYGEGNEFIQVSSDKIDFSEEERIKFISFDPRPVAWDMYNKLF